MKKFFKTLLVLVILGAGGYFGYQYYQRQQAATVMTESDSAYTEYAIGRGTLSKTVTGTGTISISRSEDVKADYAVTVIETLAEAGDTVTAGQPLMRVDSIALQDSIDALQTELESTESEMASIMNSYSSTTYVRMPQYGRIKEIYIEEGQYIQDVMEEKGCIALLSLDGWMYVETSAVEGMEIGSVLSVKVGRTELEGTVRALENGMATVTFSDAYGTEGGEVELTFNKESIGTAISHIHMPYRLTTSEKGYISAIYLEVDDRKWEGNRVCYLINVPVSDTYDALSATRLKQEEEMKEMKALMASGTINAPADGIVSSITAASSVPQEADTVLASLYVGSEKEMVVSVDELDIISVELGQSVSLAMDAITDKTYSGTVSKVSQIGMATSGVTVYSVTIAIDGDEQLKLGMNGTATIQVEERSDVLLVPIAALNASRGTSYVWLKSAEAAEDEPGVRTEVETGLSDENYAEVVSGLNEGDVVLITREASTSTSTSDSVMEGGMMFDMGTMPSGGDVPGGGQGGGSGGGPGGGNGGGRPGN